MGNIRHTHFGEGEYDVSERVISSCWPRRAGPALPTGLVDGERRGRRARRPTCSSVLSARNLHRSQRAPRASSSPGGQVPGIAHDYAVPPRLGLNHWALAGRWTVGDEDAVLNAAPGKHRVCVPSARPASRARPALPMASPCASACGSTARCPAPITARTSTRRRRARDRAAAVSVDPPVGRCSRPDVRDRVLGSRRDGLRVHVRLTIGATKECI